MEAKKVDKAQIRTLYPALYLLLKAQEEKPEKRRKGLVKV